MLCCCVVTDVLEAGVLNIQGIGVLEEKPQGLLGWKDNGYGDTTGQGCRWNKHKKDGH